jgi:hypothetical protein
MKSYYDMTARPVQNTDAVVSARGSADNGWTVIDSSGQ